MKMPLKEDANVVKYTYPADPKYLILPYELYRAIWSRAIENKYEYTETLFDCASFATSSSFELTSTTDKIRVPLRQ